ncbi:class I SAM-dependent methyltransferase [soil metagenome]
MPTSRLADASATFGSGALEPYDHALRDTARTLHLVESDSTAEPVRVDVSKFLAHADDHDADALTHAHGPVIDLGCGPGRLVRAAILGGHLALGIDASRVAVRIAQENGLPVLCRSLFQDLPAEGTWGTAMLIDGNIGIGGDPVSLLRRCAELVLAHGEGRVLVEAHPEADRYRVFDAVVTDDLGRSSLPFAWAEVGIEGLLVRAREAGLQAVHSWTRGGRTFAEFASAP